MRPYKHSRFSAPSAWETWAGPTRSQTALSYLKVEGLRVKYVGPGEEDSQAATIIANHPAPADCPLYFFEVEVVNKGQEGFIGIGFQRDDVGLQRLPGWEGHSYGYHGDDGHCFAGDGRGSAYGPKYTSGDVIGALLNRADKTISYFKNGTALGVAFRNVTDEKLHPCVGLRTRAEEIVGNFGATPFVVDLEALTSGFKEQVLSSVRATPVPLVSSRGAPLLPQMLHDHLMHHRFTKTAAIVARDMLLQQQQQNGAGHSDGPHASSSTNGANGSANGSASASGASDAAAAAAAAARHSIFQAVQAGNIKGALAEVSALLGPSFLEGEAGLAFRLHIQAFCELLRGGDTENALAYGRTALATHTPRGPAEEELLSDALSLLAYDAPASSPCGHLMSQANHASLAEALIAAILKRLGLPTVSPLERALQQVEVVVADLKARNHPAAQVLDLRAILFAQAATPPPAGGQGQGGGAVGASGASGAGGTGDAQAGRPRLPDRVARRGIDTRSLRQAATAAAAAGGSSGEDVEIIVGADEPM